MTVRVDRLRIVCRAGARSSARAIAARHRLELIARHHLPEALERAVGLDGAIEIDRLRVRLDFEPADYDDTTVATLWASRIGAALASTITDRERLVPPPEEASRREGGESAVAPVSERQRLLELARLILATDENRSAAMAFSVVVLADAASAEAVLADGLPGAERASLIARLVRIAQNARGRPRDDEPEVPSGIPGRPVRAVRHGRGGTAPIPGATPWFDEVTRQCRRIAPASTRRPRRGGSRTEAIADPVAGVRAGRPAPARDDRALQSSIAGLALVWPWLRSYLDDATGRRPDVDPVNVRRLALAAIVPESGDLVDDPLVRLLAGDDPAAKPSDIFVSAGELAGLAGPAVELIHTFAHALPGFATSSVAFIRREFIVRPGTVVPRDGFVEVRIHAMPLDPVLALLAYPIGALRLPWTAPIAVKLETL